MTKQVPKHVANPPRRAKKRKKTAAPANAASNACNSANARERGWAEAAIPGVEEQMEEWQRKRSRLEAGLPEAPDDRQPGSNQPGGASSRCEKGVFDVGGRVETVLASAPAVAKKRPDDFDATFRGLMPGMIKIMPSGDRSGPGSHAEDCGSGGLTEDTFQKVFVEVSEDEVERWQAPWMAGLMNRARGDGGGKELSVDGGISGRGVSKSQQIPEPALADDSKKGELSDLHHEILRFSEYVSLTPAEVEARENMKRSVKTVAVNAFGPGASVGFFGSYPRDERFGTNVTAPGENFSIFLSDVDIFVKPDGGGDGPGGVANAGGSPPGEPSGTVIDLTLGEGFVNADAFEEGSNASEQATPCDEEGKSVSASPGLVEEGAGRLAIQKLGTKSGAAKATPSSVVTTAGGIKTLGMFFKRRSKEARSRLKHFGKELQKNAWIMGYEFHKCASEVCVAPNIQVPGISCRDARSGVESDIVWGGHRRSEALAAQIGPAYFSAMFPGAFLPLVKFLKVLMYQRNLDNPCTGRIGSFRLYVLVAAYLEACGPTSSTVATGSLSSASADLGKLLMGFLRRYASDSQDALTSKSKLQVKIVKVKLKSAYRADSASQTFKEALCLLSKPTPANSGSSSSSGEEDAVMVQVRAGDLELQRSRGRRGSILGRVIWGSDLRKEREARLAAVGSAKASPAPQEPDPAWHRELEALSIPGPRDNRVISIKGGGPKRKNANNGGGGAKGGPAGSRVQPRGKKMTKKERKAAMSPAAQRKATAQRESAAARKAAGHFRGYKLKTLRKLYPNGVDETLKQNKKARKVGGP